MRVNSMDIRYAQKDDVQALAELFSVVVGGLAIYNSAAKSGEISKFNERELLARIKEDQKSVSVATEDEKMIGFCISQDQHGPIWVEWYGVHPDVRRRGIGAALIDHLISEAPSRGGTKIWCDTRVNNLPSIQLFEARGFQQLCTLKEHWYGQDFYLWELRVA